MSKPLRVVSLFCGAGFADYALELASVQTGIPVEVVFAVDSWAKAAKVRDANLGGARTTVADVKLLHPSDLPPHDLVIGGPPCQDHSLAGARKCRCEQGEEPVPRCCLADFVRLSAGKPYLMENVVPRLINAPFAVKLNAFDFGDVTTRKRWFYSDHLLHVIETPGPRRFGDIRDHEADRIVGGKRAELRVITHRPRTNETGCEPYATFVENHGAFGSITSDAAHNTKTLKVGLRGHSASASASAFEDDEPIGSLVSNAWHGNEIGKLGPGVRCPSLLEMQRAHSVPDSWDWAGTTKTDRGKMISNGWPIGLGTAVLTAVLNAVAYSRESAA